MKLYNGYTDTEESDHVPILKYRNEIVLNHGLDTTLIATPVNQEYDLTAIAGPRVTHGGVQATFNLKVSAHVVQEPQGPRLLQCRGHVTARLSRCCAGLVD